MKLTLAGKTQAAARIPVLKGRSIHPLHVGQPGAMRRSYLAVELVFRLFRRNKQVSIQSFKIAGNLLFSDDGLDTINRSRVTCSGEPRALLAEELFKFVIAVVERVREMRGCAPGL